MLLRNAFTSAVQQLTDAHVGSPRLNAEILLMFVLNCDRAYLYAHPERELTPEEGNRYQEVVARRASGIPSQYITGHQEFWGLDFVVTPAVLIPRPETEHLIEAVLPRAKALTRPRIVDVGTGSGCIAITLAKELAEAEIYATDNSAAALEIARENAARHEQQARIKFQETDLLQCLPINYFNFVVSNPPYVGESEEDTVQMEVRKHEPRTAVFAGPSGTEVIERLIPEARAALMPGGWLMMEVSGTVADRVEQLLRDWAEVTALPDLQGIPRVIIAKKM
ncbi:MAG TPA: peptide chain release factor N(5)-glutamine methyltransferase [Terriglobales bacterium]|nr:peptide chain release factor N(5)-glutamine methyltransferase [Terriglobales bacterium]